jgi:hypothetical protein
MDDVMFSELRRLELLLMDPAVRRDRERVSSLLAADFVEFGSSGRVWTRDSIIELMGCETYEAPTAEGFACRMLDERVALVTYKTVRMTAKRERVFTLRSSLWTIDSGNWKLRFHQGTRASE